MINVCLGCHAANMTTRLPTSPNVQSKKEWFSMLSRNQYDYQCAFLRTQRRLSRFYKSLLLSGTTILLGFINIGYASAYCFDKTPCTAGETINVEEADHYSAMKNPEWYFDEKAVVNLNVAHSVNAGAYLVPERSTINFNTASAFSNGRLFSRGYNNFNLNASNSVTGGLLEFGLGDKIYVTAENAVNGGLIKIGSNSTTDLQPQLFIDSRNAFGQNAKLLMQPWSILNIRAENGIGAGEITTQGWSTINVNASHGIIGGNWFIGGVLNANTPYSIMGGKFIFENFGYLDIHSEYAIGGGEVWLNNNTLRLEKENSIFGGTQYVRGYFIVNETNAVTGGHQILHSGEYRIFAENGTTNNVRVTFAGKDDTTKSTATIGLFESTVFGSINSYDGSGKIYNWTEIKKPVTLTIDGSLLGDSYFSGQIIGFPKRNEDLRLVLEGGKKLTLTGENTYGLGTVINSGTLSIGDGNNTGSIIGDVLNNDRLVFNRSDDIGFDGAISGRGSLEKRGIGSLTLNAQNIYTGATNINNGTLKAGNIDIFKNSSNITVAKNSVFDLNNYDQTVNALTNNGFVYFGSKPGTILTIQGNYTGNEGTLVFNTVLGDDKSLTDKMTINGDTSGKSYIDVINHGGIGGLTNEGIKLITVGGRSNGDFKLVSDYQFNNQPTVVVGAYGYQLFKGSNVNGDDGNWYLRSNLYDEKPDPNPKPKPKPEPEPDPDPEVKPTPDLSRPTQQKYKPIYQPGVPIYEGYLHSLQQMNVVETLRERIGARYNSLLGIADFDIDNAANAMGFWMRSEGSFNQAQPSSKTGYSSESNIFKFQAGIDGDLWENDEGVLIGGIAYHHVDSDTNIQSLYGDGDIKSRSNGIGASLTWLGNDNLYVDAQMQYSWYKSNLKSDLAKKTLIKDNHAFGQVYSIEVGKSYHLNDSWSLTPQAQLSYSMIDLDSFQDVWNTAINDSKSRNLRGRYAIALDWHDQWQGAGGTIDSLHIFGIANVYNEFLDGNGLKVDDLKLTDSSSNVWGGIGIGADYKWDDKYSVFGQVSFDGDFKAPSQNNGFKGNVGFTLKW